MPKLEYRTLTEQPPGVRMVAGPADPTIRGIAVVYDQLSLDLGGYRERIAPGAITFADDVWALYCHNTDQVLGRVSAGTLRLVSLLDGVHFEVTPPDTQYVRDMRASMDRGDVSGCSFGFFLLQEDWVVENNTPVRVVTRGVLHEITIGPMPVYPQTSAQANG